MFPIELITMAGGAAMGGLFKFMDQAQKNRAEQQKLLIERNESDQKLKNADRKSATASADAAAKRVGNDPFAKMTRRMFVLSMLAMGAWAMTGALTGLDIVMPVEVQKGVNILGIFDNTHTVTEFVRLENAIVHFEWLKISILAAGSFYLGKS